MQITGLTIVVGVTIAHTLKYLPNKDADVNVIAALTTLVAVDVNYAIS